MRGGSRICGIDKLVYRGQSIVILLAGGDKRTQDRDIKIAHALAGEL
jgi:putative component of toxin-antitoxin plasmid stabilization module